MFSFRRLVCVLLAAMFVLAASLASAQDPPNVAIRKIDRSLRESLSLGGRTKRVIVTVKPGYRADIRRALESHGDVIRADSAFIEALVAEIHTEDVAELAKHPWIELISDDAIVRSNGMSNQDVRRRIDNAKRRISSKATAPATTTTDAPIPASTLRQTLGLPKIPSTSTMTGRGIGVAIVDSGLMPNSDFSYRITAFYDFTRGGVSASPSDEFGHGTHVAGLIGSNGALSNSELLGVATKVDFIGVKVLDQKGEGRASDVIKAIEYLTANKSRLNVRVMNLSLGHPIFAPAQDDPMVRAVEKASAAGIVVVVAAGNYGQSAETGEVGYTGIASPGNAPSAITVGAVNTQNTSKRSDDVVAPYSSRGPSWFDGYAKPNVLAPGTSLPSDMDSASYLYTLLPANRKKAANGKRFMTLSGTSMAAAVTSGVVAVVLEANDEAQNDRNPSPLSPNAVKAILEYTAIPVAGADPLTQGAGSINAIGAIALASAIDTSKSTGNWWLRSGVNSYSYIDNVKYDWSQHVVWGAKVLTGNLVYYRESAWSVYAKWDSDNIVWGTQHAQTVAQNIVWGTTAVWASNIVWPGRVLGQMSDGDNIVWGTSDDNIVWGTLNDDNIVWGTWDGDNIVWGTWDDDNIVWGTTDGDNIVWGTLDDNIVWGTDDDNIVWGTAAPGASY